MSKPTVIIITGPTASGKSALAISLAQKLGTEIISADSRQIYKGIPIVTAVPSIEERQGINHFLMEVLPLEGYYSAARFQEDAKKIIDNILDNREYAIVCGGSMLYIDALVNGIDALPTVPEEIRLKLTKEWRQNGDEWLLNQLLKIDPDYHKKVDLKNLKRVFHAIEISITAGQPYSSLLTGSENTKPLPYDIIKICLNGEREKLFARINNRVDLMIEAGLIEEAHRVYDQRELNSLNTVGLKELFAYFDGLFTLPEAISRIQKNTRVYAKKQLTWHKRDSSIKYLDFSDTIAENTLKILESLKNRSL